MPTRYDVTPSSQDQASWCLPAGLVASHKRCHSQEAARDITFPTTRPSAGFVSGAPLEASGRCSSHAPGEGTINWRHAGIIPCSSVTQRAWNLTLHQNGVNV